MVVGKVNAPTSSFEKVGELWLRNGLKKLVQEELLFYQVINNSILKIKAT